MISIKYDELVNEIDKAGYQEADKSSLETEFIEWLKEKDPSLYEIFNEQRLKWERLSLNGDLKVLSDTDRNLWWNLMHDKNFTLSDSEKNLIEVRKMWKQFRNFKCPSELKANQHPEGVPQGVGGIAGTDEDVIRQRRGNFGPNAY